MLGKNCICVYSEISTKEWGYNLQEDCFEWVCTKCFKRIEALHGFKEAVKIFNTKIPQSVANCNLVKGGGDED